MMWFLVRMMVCLHGVVLS